MEKENFNPKFKYCSEYKIWVVDQCEVCEFCTETEELGPEIDE